MLEHRSDNPILIVNDTDDHLELMCFQLRSVGYSTCTARDGLEGYSVARQERPGLIVSDVMMPRLDGIKLCRKIRTDFELHTTPIMLVSALRKDDASVVEGLNAGADDYLEAPYDPTLFVAKVSRLAERSRLEAHYREIVEQATDIIYTHDMQGRITSINNAGGRFLDRPPGKLLGMNIRDVLQATGGQAWRHDSAKKLEQTGVRHECIEVRNGQGEQRWLDLSLSLIKARDGMSTGVRGIARDISVLKQAEDEIRQLNETLERKVLERTAQLEEAHRELESFSYTVSHDLRAPLRFTGGLTEMLCERASSRLDVTERQCLELISKSVKAAATLVDEVLGFSQMQRADMRHSIVNMNRLVESVILELKAEMARHSVVWEVEELPEVHGDPPMLRLVLRNLLCNAVKYTGKCAEPKVEIGSVINEHEIIFCVRDNGVGFDMRDADKLFGVFQRLHSSEDFEGTGIGLATVQRIVRRHEGRAWAESVPGNGAAFYFSLPRREAVSDAL